MEGDRDAQGGARCRFIFPRPDGDHGLPAEELEAPQGEMGPEGQKEPAKDGRGRGWWR